MEIRNIDQIYKRGRVCLRSMPTLHVLRLSLVYIWKWKVLYVYFYNLPTYPKFGFRRDAHVCLPVCVRVYPLCVGGRVGGCVFACVYLCVRLCLCVCVFVRVGSILFKGYEDAIADIFCFALRIGYLCTHMRAPCPCTEQWECSAQTSHNSTRKVRGSERQT
jgi:hypothetical protein